jgi:hypothetical protein
VIVSSLSVLLVLVLSVVNQGVSAEKIRKSRCWNTILCHITHSRVYLKLFGDCQLACFFSFFFQSIFGFTFRIIFLNFHVLFCVCFFLLCISYYKQCFFQFVWIFFHRFVINTTYCTSRDYPCLIWTGQTLKTFWGCKGCIWRMRTINCLCFAMPCNIDLVWPVF